MLNAALCFVLVSLLARAIRRRVAAMRLQAFLPLCKRR